jgi:hypothetical protein
VRPSEQDGWVLIEPPLAGWYELAQRAEAELPVGSLGGVDLGALRGQVRRELGVTLAGPLLVSGHQPGFPHPGIWAKRLVLTRARELGLETLFLVVDSDEAGNVAAVVPRRSPGLCTVRHPLVAGPRGTPYEALGVPTASEWGTFVDGIARDLGTLDQPVLLERLASLDRAAGQARGSVRDLGGFLARLLPEAEAPADRELTVSRLSQTHGFVRFALGLMLDAGRYWDAHNRALRAHRAERRVRSPAQPVPDLREAHGALELPLWAVVEGRRHPVFVRREGSQVVLSSDGRELCQLPATDFAQAEGMLRAFALRPRALILTAFVRLCVADLFVHGTGGRHYELAGDRILAELFGHPPPPFAVVSATVHLFRENRGDSTDERARLARTDRDLRYHAERFLDPTEPGVAALVAEKQRLVARLEQAALGERGPDGRRLHELYQLMLARTRQLRESCASELAALGAPGALEQEARAIHCREYPWFLYDQTELKRIILAGAEAG